MKLSEYKIYDYPIYYDYEIYERYILMYINAVKSIDGVLSIYQMGRINIIGMSDIDLVVVVENKMNTLEYQKLSVKKVFGNDQVANYLFIHDVMIIDEDSFNNLNLISYSTNLVKIFGQDIKIKTISELDSKIVEFSILIDFIMLRLHQFQGYIKRRDFSMRGIIVRASSLKHSLALVKDIGIEYDSRNIELFIDNVRKDWFVKENVDDVWSLFFASIRHFNAILLRCSDYIMDNFLIYNDKNFKNNLLLLNDKARTTIFINENDLFVYNENIINDLNSLMDRVIQPLQTTIFYPSHLYFHYLSYSKTNNMLSKIISEKLTNKNLLYEVTEVYKETLEKRSNALSNYAKFLRNNKLFFSNTPFYPGFNLLLD